MHQPSTLGSHLQDLIRSVLVSPPYVHVASSPLYSNLSQISQKASQWFTNFHMFLRKFIWWYSCGSTLDLEQSVDCW